ncbi:LacI family DNA-binding transcriptional regulator [Rhodovibrionaceae bacterium A322]
MERATGKPATIEDVARLADVSIATVSRVVHSPDKVAERTRLKVQEAIARSGYAPNVLARNLRRRSSGMILVLLPDIGNPFFSSILSGIESLARQAGYGVIIGNTDNRPDKEEVYLSYLRGNQADGVILLTGHLPHGATVADLPTLPPMVALSERVSGDVVPFVGIENVSAAQMATDHLLALGHRRIAHVKGPEGNILTDRRLQGYQQALQAAGIAPDAALVVPGAFSIESGRQAVELLWQQSPRPTALFCASDEIAIGALLELTRKGVSVPQEVSVVGFDDIQFASCTTPPLTTLHQPREQMGQAAMSLLLELLADDRKGGTRPARAPVLLPAELVQRQSTADKT